MLINQFAIYRVDPNKKGRLLKQMPYQEVRAKKMPIRIEYYKQIHLDKMDQEETVMGIWKRTKVFTEISDVLVMNKSGELSCYYIDEEHPYRITGFIQLNPTGSIITMDTKDYVIPGKAGMWMATDTLIIYGKQYYLLEHQKYRKQTAAIVLDSYGKLITETGKGFDQETKNRIIDQTRTVPVQADIIKNHKPKLELFQKYYENGTYERRSESGTEKSYNLVDGCVNNLKDGEISSASHRGQGKKKTKKRTSVIKKLHEKQVAIAKRTGRPVPKYLENQVSMERSRK